MIKLNNKKITYVALADSNNSVKGVKEIWYADSNNSVKLVYRRKDALIEGEDYEKYHWLDGDGNAYIDTLITDLSVSDYIKTIFDDSANLVEPMKKRTWGREGEGKRLLIGNDNYSNRILVWGTDNFFAYYNGGNYVYDMYFDLLNNKVTVNNQIFNLSLPHGNDGLSLALFTRHLTASTFDIINRAKFKSFEIHNQIKLIPCKLIKPVPKWLDANGISRQVGECGMIDLVSGKFYGNVNSVGTFTVENYYERKEWLIGDGSAYIDTLHLANEGLDWETHVSNLSFKKHFVWNRVTDQEYPAIALYHSIVTNGIVRVQNNYTNSIELQNQTNYDYIVATNSNVVVINGVQYIGQSASENISNKSIRLFYCDITKNGRDYIIDNGGSSQDVKCSYFRFLDSNRNYILNLIPCILTMDLPASMDANNIARTKGTSGMWDLVSDRFYGNVANSGTFKAVNLAEGVDYEVHQWLKTTLNSRGTYMTLPINSDNLSFKRIISSVANSSWMVTNGFSYFSYSTTGDNPLAISCWDSNQSKSILWLYKKFDEEIEVVSTSNSLTFGGTSTEQYGYPIVNLVFANSLNGTSEFKTSSIYVDGVERYIPVKLLKSIPAKYDANGIARNTGECGMYDTVNDLFYGNVASSGSFTVEDDN